MPYLAPTNTERENQLTKKKNNNISNNWINHNNKNTSTLTTTTTTTTTSTISKTSFPISNSIYNNNSKSFSSSSSSSTTTTSSSLHTIPSSYDTHYKDKNSSSIQPPLLSTSLRRKSAPEVYLKPLSIPQKTFNQHNDDDQLITIRKKSGEIVRPSLKKRSKSEPNTPILLMLPKYVHFNADLEQVRLFDRAQKPEAASADVTSDESDDDDDDDFVFSCDDDDDDDPYIDQLEPELTISIPNMPPITTSHGSKPVFVESIFLSKDKRKLEGRIMVQNIAFHKLVEVRYTFDSWQSVSEVKATFVEGVVKKDDKKSFDLFIFSIELFDNSRNPIDNKTMYFAVHYSVNNRDYWDNNSGSNYQVNFKKIKKSSQCNHNCYHRCQNDNQKNRESLSSSKSSSSSSSSSSSPWRIIPSTPEKNRSKGLSNDCHSPPSTSVTHTSITDSRKRGISSPYDIRASLSAAQNIPRSSLFNNNNNNNKINNHLSTTTNMQTQTYYCHIPTLAISCNFSSVNYIDGMPVTTEAPSSSSFQWGNSSPKNVLSGFSTPIAIPTTESTNSYYDQIISQYCFSSGSAVSSSPYASSPTIIH